MEADVQSWHGAVHGRLKQFDALTTHFRRMEPKEEGSMERHETCFHAVAVITQVKLIHGMQIFAASLDCDVACR